MSEDDGYNVYEFRQFVDCDRCGNNTWFLFTTGVVACTNCGQEGRLTAKIMFDLSNDS